MYHIRVIKTASGSNAVQIIYYRNRKRIIFKHVGSAKDSQELELLQKIAQDIIENTTFQQPLFKEVKFDNLLYLDKCEFLGVYYSFFYETIYSLASQMGLDKFKNQLLLDLVVMRIMEPASKLRSIELLDTYFGIKHRRQNYYDSVPLWLDLKAKIESTVTSFATSHYGFKFDLLFYDVTTLYFETFEEDDLRKNGFSKDNKFQQPQILVGLLVTQQGFPIAYEIFTGNTFEGHTILPIIKNFIKKHNVKEFTVVADAAMISSANVVELVQNNINYIVGARLGNISNELLEKIDKNLTREDNKTIRIKTDNGYLICNYSSVRYRKDKYEMEKQIEKAKAIIQNPSKNKKLKFTKTSTGQIKLNEALIKKTEKLLGVKGYYTNLESHVFDNHLVIERYSELYKVEQAFRISKNDLQTRPIFHFKEQPIQLHVLICFMALFISKHIELQTGDSIKKFLSECKKVTDARMLNKISSKEIKIRAKINDKIIMYIRKLNLSH